MLGLMKSGELWTDVMGQRVWAKWSEVGELSMTCAFQFLSAPFSLEIRMFLCFKYGKATSRVRVLPSASGEDQKPFPAHAISQSPPVWNIQKSKVSLLGWFVLNSVSLINCRVQTTCIRSTWRLHKRCGFLGQIPDTESESLQLDLRHLYFNKPLWWFWCIIVWKPLI